MRRENDTCFVVGAWLTSACFFFPCLHGCRRQYISADAAIPAYPMLMDSSDGTTDLSEAAGAVGIMFNGVAVFRWVIIQSACGKALVITW